MTDLSYTNANRNPDDDFTASLGNVVRLPRRKPSKRSSKKKSAAFKALKDALLLCLAGRPKVPRAALAVGVCIATHLNSKSGEAWPSIDLIAAETNLNAGTVWRSLKRLEALQIIEIIRGRGRFAPNRYRLGSAVPGQASKTVEPQS